MIYRLMALFTILPAVELYLLLQVGSVLGPLPTVGMILATGALGAALARHAGTTVLAELRNDLTAGVPPAVRVVEGALVLVGATFLLAPGVITDLAGLSLLIPSVRAAAARRLVLSLADAGAAKGWRVDLGPTARHDAPRSHAPAAAPFDHPTA